MQSFKKWTRRTLAMNLIVVALVVLLNLIVDPYNMYQLVTISGITSNKHMAAKHSRRSKPYVIEKLNSEALAFGSSRTEVGIDPTHKGWKTHGEEVFNFGLGGAGIAEVADRFVWATEHCDFSQAVIGLDFFMFNVYVDNPFEPVGEEMEKTPLRATIAPHISSLLTTTALHASIRTLRKQDPVKSPGSLPNGQVAWTFNARRVGKYGHNSGFQRMEKNYFESSLFPLPHKSFQFTEESTGKSSFDSLKKILEVSRQKGIDLRFYISPVHARLCQVYVETGLWPTFEDWKLQLVEMIAADAAVHPNSLPFVLWDFTGYNSVTTEEVPPSGDTSTHMRWYWEASHFKKEAGDLVLSKIFSDVHDTLQPPNDFGVIINTANIEKHLQSIRKEQIRYQQEHQNDIAEVAAVGQDSTWR